MALENVYNQLYIDTNYSFSHWHIFLETFYFKPGFPLFHGTSVNVLEDANKCSEF